MTENNPQTLSRPATHTLAIVSLVLSILGLMPVLPLVGAIAGIVTGVIARREIRSRADLYSGDGMARAGIILGWIGVGLVALLCVAIILGYAFFAINTVSTSMPPAITIQPIQP